MKKFILLTLLMPVLAFATTPDNTVLPNKIKVYYNENNGLSLKPVKGSAEIEIQTSNEFTKNPGCYLFCISKNHKLGLYSVEHKTYMMGQIRVSGHYMNGYCTPTGYGDKDPRKAKEFIEHCEKSFPEKCESKSCWVDNNTNILFY